MKLKHQGKCQNVIFSLISLRENLFKTEGQRTNKQKHGDDFWINWFSAGIIDHIGRSLLNAS